MGNTSDKICVGRSFRTLGLFHVVYAGLIVCFVPLVLCNLDVTRRLTFDIIFNNTDYAQLHHRPRPYSIPIPTKQVDSKNKTFSLEDDSRGNELEIDYDFQEKDVGGPLLVGYARDPFKYSIPEQDYLRGVRYMNPQTIASGSENRGKRGVLELYNMIYCATGCEPLSYKGYGCYCGFLGSGRPTDGIDRCCKQHDRCYENMFCPVFSVYFQPYYWKCYHGEPLCALENYESQHGFINACAARLCECDRELAMCVRRYACPRRRALCRSSPLRLLQNLLMFSLLPYWKCYHGEPLCAHENYESQHGFINACAARLCECDRELAMCVRRYACPRRRALCRSSPLRLLQNLLMFR